MFYIKADITEAVILHTWVNTTAKTVVLFDKSFEVCILYYNENLDEKYQLQTQPYPLILELQSINKDLGDWCPYLAFQHNIHSQFYHMDKGESLTIWSQIVYPENRGLYIVVEHYEKTRGRGLSVKRGSRNGQRKKNGKIAKCI